MTRGGSGGTAGPLTSTENLSLMQRQALEYLRRCRKDRKKGLLPAVMQAQKPHDYQEARCHGYPVTTFADFF